MNIMITGEEYNEYEVQKEKIKELEARNNFLKDQYQQVVSEKVALIKERDRLTNVVHKQGSDIISLRAKNNDLNEQNKTIVNQDKMIETLQAKIADYDNKDIRFKEIVTENYRLRMSNNDLKENNKALKKENEKLINRLHDYESQIAELAEKATNPDYVKFLETAKKFQESNVGILTELEETTQPERNVTIIENLYITNNYFSEEDKDHE